MTTLPELNYRWDAPTVHIGHVTLTGDLTHLNATEILRAIEDELATHPRLRELHVDCAGLEFCDSGGLSALLMLRRRTESLGLDLRLVNRSQMLARMLDRTGTTEYLTSDRPLDTVRDQEPSG